MSIVHWGRGDRRAAGHAVHKPADALTISTLMVRGGSARWFVHLVNFGFGLMIPAGVVLFVVGTSAFAPERSGVDHGRSAFVFGRHVPVHCSFGPASRASVPLARPAEAVACAAGGGGADGVDGGFFAGVR